MSRPLACAFLRCDLCGRTWPHTCQDAMDAGVEGRGISWRWGRKRCPGCAEAEDWPQMALPLEGHQPGLGL